MKKLFLLTITIFSIFLMQSCFLFKPVQKTCPAYSINQLENENINIVYFQDDASNNVKSL